MYKIKINPKNTNTINISEAVGDYKTAIDKAMISYFMNKLVSLKTEGVSRFTEEALEMLKDFSTRQSKRIRGFLAWFTYDSLAKKPNINTGKKLAIAIELIQSYLLIIDDVADKSPFRRGKPTIHELYKQHYSLEKDPTSSNIMAVMVGLLAHHLANELILSCEISSDRIKTTLNNLHKNIVQTCFGEIDDIMSPLTNSILIKEDVYKIYKSKSSYYTFINPIQTGISAAGIKNKTLTRAVQEYGLLAGVAFQIQDDIIGMFGDSREVGKSNLDDLKEGKNTLLVAYSRKMAKTRDIKFLNSMLGRPSVTENQHVKVCQIMSECGALAKAKSEAAKLAGRAIKAISEAPLLSQEAKQVYKRLVEYSINRTY